MTRSTWAIVILGAAVAGFVAQVIHPPLPRGPRLPQCAYSVELVQWPVVTRSCATCPAPSAVAPRPGPAPRVTWPKPDGRPSVDFGIGWRP